MNIIHPDERTMIFMQTSTNLLAEMELIGPGWVSFGFIGGDQRLLVDVDEWPAFFKMVNEIDAARHQRRRLK